MNSSKRILFPVDLSTCSLSALEMATKMAKAENATICFFYIEPITFPDEAIYAADIRATEIEADVKRFKKIRPTDDSVSFEHVSMVGNPGPSIVKATEDMDLCIMSSHGRSGVMRFLMGSVAEYVLRHSKCPVIIVKGFETDGDEPIDSKPEAENNFVTSIMRQVAPVHAADDIEIVLDMLKKAGETGAPVVDTLNYCIGVLTTTDIEIYHELKKRFAAGDTSVVQEMFEADEYGQFRCGNSQFDNVARHMTEEVVSIGTNQSIATARKMFAANPEIHHLVVLDPQGHPVGMVDATDVPQEVPQDA